MYRFITNVCVLFFSYNLVQSENVSPNIAGVCEMAAFYLELGCTPSPKLDNSTNCPEAFSCGHLYPDHSKCYYRGITYEDGATLPENVIQHVCSRSCHCSVNYGRAEFSCAVIDCWDAFHRLPDNCIMSPTLTSCCSAPVCDKDVIAKLSTCEFEGKTYKEGQSFYPKDTHKTCVCTSAWDGNLDKDANCRDINCGLEIHYQNYFKENCAPVFYENRMSCPIGFECQQSTTKVIRNTNVQTANHDQCTLGNLKLNVGDEISVDDNCTKCTCNLPPFVSCVKTSCNIDTTSTVISTTPKRNKANSTTSHWRLSLWIFMTVTMMMTLDLKSCIL